MKLIVQADDYAMTDGVAEGILHAARYGILTQTGLMTNGPHAEYYAKRMENECPHVSLGMDVNLVSGRPLSDPKTIPTLVDENGILIKSGVHKKRDKEGDPNHIAYEDAYREIEAQVLKFFEITGHKPYYIIGHSYDCENTNRARADVIEKYGLTTFEYFRKKAEIPETGFDPWWTYSAKENLMEAQWNAIDPLDMFKNNQLGYFQDHVNEKDTICFFHTHAGFVDDALLKMSSLTITRVREENMLCDPYVVNWVKEHNVELIGSRELAAIIDEKR